MTDSPSAPIPKPPPRAGANPPAGRLQRLGLSWWAITGLVLVVAAVIAFFYFSARFAGLQMWRIVGPSLQPHPVVVRELGVITDVSMSQTGTQNHPHFSQFSIDGNPMVFDVVGTRGRGRLVTNIFVQTFPKPFDDELFLSDGRSFVLEPLASLPDDETDAAATELKALKATAPNAAQP